MKKLALLLLLAAFIAVVGCDDDAPKGDLTVQVNFSDSDPAYGTYDDTQPGTGLKVVVWKDGTDFETTEPDVDGLSGQTASAYTGSISANNGTVTLSVREGDYLVMGLYDYKAHNNNLVGKADLYAFFITDSSQTYTPAEAATVTVASDAPASIKIDITGSYKIQSNGLFDAP